MDYNNKNNTDDRNEENTVDEYKNTDTLDRSDIKKILAISILGISFFLMCFLLVNTCILGHKWSEATCIKPRTCTKCKITEGNALGHDWIEANCEIPKKCLRCGATTGAALGHKTGEWTVVKQETCTEGGEKEAVCSVCGKNVTEEIPATGHTLGKWEIGTEATLVSSGEKVQKCVVCGDVINTDRYYLTEDEKAEIIQKQKEAEEAEKKAAQKAKEDAERMERAARYTITPISAERSGSSFVKIKFKIKNNTDSDRSNIKIRGTLYDSNGNAITSGNTYIYDLPANQVKEDNILIQYSGSDYVKYSVEVL